MLHRQNGLLLPDFYPGATGLSGCFMMDSLFGADTLQQPTQDPGDSSRSGTACEVHRHEMGLHSSRLIVAASRGRKRGRGFSCPEEVEIEASEFEQLQSRRARPVVFRTSP